ncbi:MAG: ChaN family lipoprotein [Pseudomonadales bacterium]|nr:ChaN family lipoprotein [Pseudomonadales bacterium]
MLLLPLVLLLACSGAMQNVLPEADWQSAYQRNHVLTGRILRSADGAFIDEKTLLQELSTAAYLLLGEKHDNPDHHRLRHRLLQELIKRDEVAAISLEMLDSSQSAALTSVIDAGLDTAGQVRNALDWDEGWTWEYYAPSIMLALQHQLPLLAANLSAEEVMAHYTGSSADSADFAESPYANILMGEQLTLLQTEIRASHCDMLPESQLPAMLRVQQARDWRMARSLQQGQQLAGQAGKAGASVLLAGNFHIRRDLGVPAYLVRNAEYGGEDVLSVAWLEVDASVSDPALYLDSISGQGDFDYIWFTPVSSQEDYCSSLRSAAAF